MSWDGLSGGSERSNTGRKKFPQITFFLSHLMPVGAQHTEGEHRDTPQTTPSIAMIFFPPIRSTTIFKTEEKWTFAQDSSAQHWFKVNVMAVAVGQVGLAGYLLDRRRWRQPSLQPTWPGALGLRRAAAAALGLTLKWTFPQVFPGNWRLPQVSTV